MMGLIDKLLGPIGGVLENVIPDVNERAKLAHEIATMAEKNAHELNVAQVQANIEAAKHPSIFVAGARPAALWVCVVGLAFQVGVRVAAWGLEIYDPSLTIPEPPIVVDTVLLGGLLGLGGMRSFEKWQGVERNNMGKSQ